MNRDKINIPFEFYYFDRLDSTNSYIKKVGKDRICVCAGEQYAGRGRMGRQWVSDNGGALMFSVSFFEKDAKRALLYPLMCGLSVCRAGGDDFFIKWPNDIIANGKKIAGILCESMPLENGLLIVCGIGINISQNREFFEKNGLTNGGSIFTQTGCKVEAEELLCKIVNTLDCYTKSKNIEKIIEEYKKVCLNIEKRVKVIGKDSTETGICEDIDIDGGLLVKTEKGLIKVQSGEVSVRGENGEYI